ncbi:cytochrome P450 [Streptomyces desertarenae]|uniref:Cytochrome P450 n=1 Tax=Streptomyces desertarenae TaxID=2666184 RepID=A0ABW4PSB3_9ACTN
MRRVLDTAVRADPYPLWNGIREHGPVWLDGGVVVFSSHAHCAEVLRSPAAHAVVPPAGCPVPHGRTPLPDAPGVREASALARRVLTPEVLAGVEEFLRGRVDDLLDSVAARGRLEAVTDLAYPLPVAAICRLFGLPRTEETRLHRLAMPLSRMWEPHPAVDGTEAPGGAEQRRAQAALDGYVAELVERRGDDVGQGLLAPVLASLPPGRPTARQVWELFRELLVSGHESTAALLSNTVMALLRAPHVLDAVRREPGYAEQVVEEVLRADPPFQLLQRRAAEDLDVCGVRVPAGTTMLLLLAAAHRDPGLRPAADVFAPGSGADGGHLAFGLGDRFCPGAPLARLAGRLVCVRFAQRVAAPRFATGTPSYRPNVALRGLRALWVDADGFSGRDLPWDRPLPPPRTSLSLSEGRAS